MAGCDVKRKRVFVSGVAGFLGSWLAEEMIKAGYKVAGCDNLLGGYLDNVPPEVEYYPYDCNNLNSMVKILKDTDTVFHCAALAYEGLSVFSPYVVEKNTVGATTSLLSAAIQNNVRRFVFCSSMARYGENDVPFTEDMIPRPRDPYGICKYASELIIQNICQVHGMEYVIAVPHNIIGPRQKYDDPFRNVASIMINLMLQGRQPIIYGDGQQKRCFTFVQDAVSSLVRMAEAEGLNGQVINVGPDDEFITIQSLAETIAEILGFDLDPVYVPARPQEVRLANCSSKKSMKLLGYSPKYSLREGLESIIEFIKARGPKPFRYHLAIEIDNQITPTTWKKKLF